MLSLRIITAAYAALVLAGLAAMANDTNRQLERCQATGRGQETCRLLVLGR
jgi:ribosomal protein S14